MDRKQKKRIDVIRGKLQQLRQQLAGARLQPDDPQEHQQIADQIQKLETELHQLLEERLPDATRRE